MPVKGFRLTHKICKGCKQDLPREAYYDYPTPGKGLSGYCKPCHHKRSCNYNRKKIAGMTEAQYQACFIAQEGLCAVCGKASPQKQLAADHDHNTGEPRGLLCSNCNLALGLLEDSPSTIKNLLSYLARYKKA